MYEFEIYNPTTNEHDFIHGYTVKDAWERRPSLNPDEWKIIFREYID